MCKSFTDQTRLTKWAKALSLKENIRLIKSILKFLVQLYQVSLSPVLAALGAECRFFPSCSRYACTCLEQDNLTEALTKISSRLIKCGPWHPGGVDLP
ncbi:MAG: membrane protein insertion efficiency factor YidD [bacterium]